MTHKLFVYGSLKRGYWNHHRLLDSTLLSVTTTAPKFNLIDLGSFPALLRNNSFSIIGELYEVNDETLSSCDHLEGHPTFYRRELIQLEDGQEVYSYIYQGKIRHVPIGDDIIKTDNILEWRPQ